MWPDPSHSAQRTFDQALRSCGLWNLWLLLLIGWNVEFGPWNERRRNELEAAMTFFYDHFEASQVPLFWEVAPLIIKEVEEGGGCCSRGSATQKTSSGIG